MPTRTRGFEAELAFDSGFTVAIRGSTSRLRKTLALRRTGGAGLIVDGRRLSACEVQ